jgi:hypothetical protein
MGEDKAKFSGVWFANPSFSGGMARVMDLGGTLNSYKIYASPNEADKAALRRDFEAVGNDIRSAVEAVKAKQRG